MKIINTSEPEDKDESLRREHMSFINELIGQSFGSRYHGDYNPFCVAPSTPDEHAEFELRRRQGTPEYICRKIFCFTQGPFARFTEKDGSALEVRRDFEEKARKYGELYEKETGKEVIVYLKDQIEGYFQFCNKVIGHNRKLDDEYYNSLRRTFIL